MTNGQHDWRWWTALAIGAAIGFGVIFMISGDAYAYQDFEISID